MSWLRRGKSSWGHRIEVTAAFLAIVAFVFWAAPKVEALFPGGDGTASLEIGEVAVANVPADFNTVGIGELDQVPATEPRIEATVRNLGAETAWIEEARIVVLDSARFSTCLSQGGGGGEVPRSNPYEIVLPDFPTRGRRVIRRQLHVEVNPEHGARPVLRFHNGSAFDTTNLYALHVEFVAAPGDHVLNVGRFVLGVPDPVHRGGQVLPENSSMLLSSVTKPGETLPTWCFHHNLRDLHRVISEPGKRSSYVAALSHLQTAQAWSAYAARSSPRAAVPDLLQTDLPEAAVYAVEAAERTGDEAFENRVRLRAVDRLLRLARENLQEEYPQGAAADAHLVLSLQSSSTAKHLLWRAEATERES